MIFWNQQEFCFSTWLLTDNHRFNDTKLIEELGFEMRIPSFFESVKYCEKEETRIDNTRFTIRSFHYRTLTNEWKNNKLIYFEPQIDLLVLKNKNIA